TDPETNMPLPGANVMVAGTSNGTTTDFDGMFTLEVYQENLQGKVVVTYVGFLQQEIPFNVQDGETLDLGEISLKADENALGEIVVVGKGVVDVALGRETPVAVSTVT
ncbi:MAG: TonB-dependent receptor, partial [Thaumarchaeota archaeon]|nr:TonB-dependent receptor [Nitrososphaerota archaeon]